MPRTPAKPFPKGNKLSPGNPYVAKIAALRSAMYNAVGTDKLKKIIDAQVRIASSIGPSSTAAAAFIFKALGVNAPEVLELNGKDGGALDPITIRVQVDDAPGAEKS